MTERLGIIFIAVSNVFEDFGDYETYIDLHVRLVPFFISRYWYKFLHRLKAIEVGCIVSTFLGWTSSWTIDKKEFGLLWSDENKP
jgi:hypothetical protein